MGKLRVGLNQAIQTIDSSGIREAFAKANSIPGIIRLAIGEPDLPMPIEIKQAMCQAIMDDKTGYTQTEGLEGLVEKALGQFAGCAFAQKGIIVPGVSAGIDLIFRVHGEVGREYAITEPFFPMYVSQCRLTGATPVLVPAGPGFRLDPDAIKKAITPKTVALFINSPNNPTGVVYTDEEIKAVAKIANKYGLMVFADNVYGALIYDKAVACGFEHLTENLVVLDGWSKSFSMTGSRVGYAVGPKWIIDAMAKAQQFSGVCANTPAQWALVDWWGQIDLSERKEAFEQRRNLVWEMLHPHFSLPKPEGAFYAWVSMPPGVTGREFGDECLNQKVLVVPAGGTFSTVDNAVRISYAVPEDLLRRGLEGMIAAKQALVR